MCDMAHTYWFDTSMGHYSGKKKYPRKEKYDD